MRRHAPATSAARALPQGQAARPFSGAGVSGLGRGRGAAGMPQPSSGGGKAGGDALTGIFAVGDKAATSTSSGPAKPQGNAVYSLTNFAARAQVVPVVKGHGMKTVPTPSDTNPTQQPPPRAAAATPTAKKTPSMKLTPTEEALFKSFGPPRGGVPQMAPARELGKSAAATADGSGSESALPVVAASQSASAPRSPSAMSFRLSGQSLLKSLAQRSTTFTAQNVYAANANSATKSDSVGAGGLGQGQTKTTTTTTAVSEEAIHQEKKCAEQKRADAAEHLRLVRHLIAAVHERKVIDWARLPAAVRQLPAFHRRRALTAHLAAAGTPQAAADVAAGSGSNVVNGASASLPPILCTGDTGCGKSLVAPLAIVDLHWRGVVIALARYAVAFAESNGLHLHVDDGDGKGDGKDGMVPDDNTSNASSSSKSKEELGVKSGEEGDAARTQVVGDADDNLTKPSATSDTEDGGDGDVSSSSSSDSSIDATIVPAHVRRAAADYAGVPESFIPFFDPSAPSEAFLADFAAASRLRIYVSQPTRLAAKSLAEFFNESLAPVTSPATHGWVPTAEGETEDDSSVVPTPAKAETTTDAEKKFVAAALPLGFRVGYATALDKCLAEESCEVVFATVGYLLNRLASHSNAAAHAANARAALNSAYHHHHQTASSSSSSSSGAVHSMARRLSGVVGGDASVAADAQSAEAMRASTEAAEFNVLTQQPTPNMWANEADNSGGAEAATPPAPASSLLEAARRHDSSLPFTLILDEAHRRDLQSDLLMTWAREWHRTGAALAAASASAEKGGGGTDVNKKRQLQKPLVSQRVSLLAQKRRLLVMSASIDHALFESYFYDGSGGGSEGKEMKGDGRQMEEEGKGDPSAEKRVGARLAGALPFDLAAEGGEEVAVSAPDPFPPEFAKPSTCTGGSTETSVKKADTVAGAATEAKPLQQQQPLKAFDRLVLYGDDLLELSKHKAAAAAAANEGTRGKYGFSSSSPSAHQQLLATSPAGEALRRASSGALEALYTAAFSAVDFRTSPHAAKAALRARISQQRGGSGDESRASAGGGEVDLLDAVAKVAVQCVARDEHVLIFVAGFDEISRVAIAVAQLNEISPARVNLTPREDTFAAEHAGDRSSSASSSSAASSVGPALSFLKKGSNVVVDLVALHATALGEASAQLRASKAKAKIIVATNVAESSITIPGVALVLNTGYERVTASAAASAAGFGASQLSGGTGSSGGQRLVTQFASKSSFLQREGRTGRTCAGAVVHLLRRGVFDALPAHTAPRWLENGESEQLLLTAKLLFSANGNASALLPPVVQPPQHFQPLAGSGHHSSASNSSSGSSVGSAAGGVELLAAPLFSLSALCARLPAPITDPSILLPHAVALCDAGVLSNPETLLPATSAPAVTSTAATPANVIAAPDETAQGGAAVASEAALLLARREAAWRLLDAASLTFKGRFVAALPLPPTLALLTYNGFMHGCLDAALLAACAMDAAITHISPMAPVPQRLMEHGMRNRFELARRAEAGPPPPPDSNNNDVNNKQQQQSTAHLLPSQPRPSDGPPSDAWLHFALMDEWYATRHSDKRAFARRYVTSTKAMLAADERVAMCAAKVIDILVPLFEALGGTVDGRPPSSSSSLSHLQQQQNNSATNVYARGRLRATLRRMQQLRKHALGNVTALRASRHLRAGGASLPTLARCHAYASPSEAGEPAVSLFARLRAAYVSTYFGNMMVGYVNPHGSSSIAASPLLGGGAVGSVWGAGPGASFETSANAAAPPAVLRLAATAVSEEKAPASQQDPQHHLALTQPVVTGGAFSLSLTAGARPLPLPLLAHYSQRDVLLALNRMFRHSTLVKFSLAKYLPSHAALVVSVRDTSSVTVEDAIAIAHGGDESGESMHRDGDEDEDLFEDGDFSSPQQGRGGDHGDRKHDKKTATTTTTEKESSMALARSTTVELDGGRSDREAAEALEVPLEAMRLEAKPLSDFAAFMAGNRTQQQHISKKKQQEDGRSKSGGVTADAVTPFTTQQQQQQQVHDQRLRAPPFPLWLIGALPLRMREARMPYTASPDAAAASADLRSSSSSPAFASADGFELGVDSDEADAVLFEAMVSTTANTQRLPPPSQGIAADTDTAGAGGLRDAEESAAHSKSGASLAQQSSVAEKAIALSGRLVRDERTGACTHFTLHSDPYAPHTTEHGEEGKAYPPQQRQQQRTNLTGGSSPPMIDLVKAAALGFGEWAPTEKTIATAVAAMEERAILRRCGEAESEEEEGSAGVRGGIAEAAMPSRQQAAAANVGSAAALIAAAKPLHKTNLRERFSSFNASDGQLAANTFVALRAVAVPYAVQWAAPVRPKAILSAIEQHMAVQSNEVSTQRAKRMTTLQTEEEAVVRPEATEKREEGSTVGASSSSDAQPPHPHSDKLAKEAEADGAAFLHRVVCPVCCESLPADSAAARALHITRPRHLRALQRAIAAGASAGTVGRIVGSANTRPDTALVNAYAGTVRELAAFGAEEGESATARGGKGEWGLTSRHKRLLTEAIAFQSNAVVGRSIAPAATAAPATAGGPAAAAAIETIHMRDLVAAEDEPRPVPATMHSHSLAALLTAPPPQPPQPTHLQTLPRGVAPIRAPLSSAVAVAFAAELSIRAASATVTANRAWVIDPSERSDALLLLQTAVLQAATLEGGGSGANSTAAASSASSASPSWRPLMLLMDRAHSKVYGYCLVGLVSVSFGDRPLAAAAVQQLLEMKNGAAQSATLFGVAEEQQQKAAATTNTPTTTSSSAAQPLSSLSAAPIGAAAITKLQETLIRGLQPLDVPPSQSSDNAAVVATSLSSAADEERHWCPLQFPCADVRCERARQSALAFADRRAAHLASLSPHSSSASSSALPSRTAWSPDGPIERVVSGAIIALLNEGRLAGHSRASLPFFVQRLLATLDAAAKSMGVGGRTRVVEVPLEGLLPAASSSETSASGAGGGVLVVAKARGGDRLAKAESEEAKKRTVPVEVETAGGVRLLEGYLKQRGAPSLEHVLLHCGCVFTTTQWDGTFFLPAVLPTAVPSPRLIEAIQTGVV